MANSFTKQSIRGDLSKPLFVAISDVHYQVSNLDLADKAWRTAIDKAHKLGIPLIDAGDITNDKAILRGEVMNMLLDTKDYADSLGVRRYLIVGNHSLLNEKGEGHVLRFLNDDLCHIVSHPTTISIMGQPVYLIPYQNTVQKFQDALGQVPKGSIVVCHQGVQGAHLGDYVQDKTSIEVSSLDKSHKIISGHYHRHQTVGPLTYIGSPFTHTFGESNDGEKGFLIVNSDGSYTREILTLRAHIKLELSINDINCPYHWKLSNPNHIVWLQITGPQSELAKLDKNEIGNRLFGHSNFKLDLIPNNGTQSHTVSANVKLSSAEMMDRLIDSLAETSEYRNHLKSLYKGILCS